MWEARLDPHVAPYGTVQLSPKTRAAYFLMPEQQEPKSAAPVTPATGGPELEQGSGRTNDTSMQPTTTSSTASPDPAPPTQATPQQQVAQRIPYWLRQAERFLRVIVQMYLGLLVCLAPWFPAAWDANPLFTSSPSVLAFVTQGWVRGIVSGLGLLNLWIALRNAIRDPDRE